MEKIKFELHENINKKWVKYFLKYDSIKKQLHDYALKIKNNEKITSKDEVISINLDPRESDRYCIEWFLHYYEQFMQYSRSVFDVEADNNDIAKEIVNTSLKDEEAKKLDDWSNIEITDEFVEKDIDDLKQIDLSLSKNNVIDDILIIAKKYPQFIRILNYYDVLDNPIIDMHDVISTNNPEYAKSVISGRTNRMKDIINSDMAEMAGIAEVFEISIPTNFYQFIQDSPILYSDKIIAFNDIKDFNSFEAFSRKAIYMVQKGAISFADKMMQEFRYISNNYNEDEAYLLRQQRYKLLQTLYRDGLINDADLNMLFRASLLHDGYDKFNKLSSELLEFIHVHRHSFIYNNKFVSYYQYFYQFKDYNLMVKYYLALPQDDRDELGFRAFINSLNEEEQLIINNLLNTSLKLTKEQ